MEPYSWVALARPYSLVFVGRIRLLLSLCSVESCVIWPGVLDNGSCNLPLQNVYNQLSDAHAPFLTYGFRDPSPIQRITRRTYYVVRSLTMLPFKATNKAVSQPEKAPNSLMAPSDTV